MDDREKYHMSVTQSIIGSFKEIKAMREEHRNGTTWNEFMNELREEERLEQENASRTDRALQGRF